MACAVRRTEASKRVPFRLASGSGAVGRGGGLLAVPCCSLAVYGTKHTRAADTGINGFHRPVLKHGPRSLTYARVFGWQTQEAE